MWAGDTKLVQERCEGSAKSPEAASETGRTLVRRDVPEKNEITVFSMDLRVEESGGAEAL